MARNSLDNQKNNQTLTNLRIVEANNSGYWWLWRPEVADTVKWSRWSRLNLKAVHVE
jgi:hypothetical protein